MSDFREAIETIQALRDEIHVPGFDEDEETEARDLMDSEDYGRYMAYENVLDILQLLAHGVTPEQGS
jgi:hypothetical protein